jgi:hypothetical protein
MALRGIGFSRVSMQRAGALLAVTDAAHETRSTDLAGITTRYVEALWRSIQLEDESDVARVQTYIDEQRLRERYPKFYGKPGALQPGERVDAQDFWLADRSLPSSTGAIRRQSAHELPQLASELQLLRPENYTRTDRGNALRVVSMRKIQALTGDARTENPLALTSGQQLLLLFTFLDADFDVVREIYRDLLLREETMFTRADVSGVLPDACRRLIRQWQPEARRGHNLEKLLRLQELAKEIEKSQAERKVRSRTGTTWGGARPPESTGTVRLEPYVDLALLGKPERSKYTYAFNDRQRGFFSALVEAADPSAFLENDLIVAYLRSQGQESERSDDDAIWHAITNAYEALRSRLGYAAFREVVLLAIAQLVDAGTERYFEIADGIGVIRRQKESDPRSIKFGVARGGGLTYIKIAGGQRT